MSLDANNENTFPQSAPRLPDVVIPIQTTNRQLQDETKERSTQIVSQSVVETPHEIGQNETEESKISANLMDTGNLDSKVDTKSTISSLPNEEVSSTSIVRNSNNKPLNEADEASSFTVAGLIANNASPSPISNTNNQPKVPRATIIRHQSQPIQPSQQSPMIAHRSKSINASTIPAQTIPPVIPALSTQPRKPLQPIPLIQLPTPSTQTTPQIQPQIQPPQTINVKIDSQPYINSNNPPSPTAENPYMQKPSNYPKPMMPAPNVQYAQPFHQHPPPQPPQNL